LFKFIVVIHAIFFNLISLNIQAAELTVDVIDMAGLPVENAVVYAEPDNPVAMPQVAAIIEQRGKQFNPLVSVIQTGADVTFPNFDSVRHHVYSFSPAKTFELKLYSGVPTSPVKFDKAGTVVLGCNIHDTMVAFIQVVDTPYFTKSNKLGKALLRDLPNGGYTLKVWHYALAKDKEVVEKKLQVRESQPVVMQVSLKTFILPARK